MAIVKNWIDEAALELYEKRDKVAMTDRSFKDAVERFSDIIAKHCPFKSGVVYMEHAEVAKEVHRLTDALTAKVVELAALLRESKRDHDRTYMDEANDYPPCPLSVDGEGGSCTCGADAWNARVGKALEGV